MGFFDKLGDSIVNATQEVGKQAKGMTDVAKLQYEARSKEDFLNKQYQEIGKKFYEENKDNVPEDYAVLFEEVDGALKRIAEIKEQVAYNKGGKACPNCGAVVTAGSSFCASCGAKVEDLFEEEEVVSAEETAEATPVEAETVEEETEVEE